MKHRLLPLSFAVALTALCSTGFAAQTQPIIKVDILEPKLSNILSGNIEVRARFTPDPGAPMPEQALVGIGGASWVKMSRVEPSGEWVAVADTTLVPNGPQSLIVVTDQRCGRSAVDVTITNTMNAFSLTSTATPRFRRNFVTEFSPVIVIV
ncbi:MAG TPA: hypothetical protein P5555_07410 [Candidatus Paceibacterota bacterium]|nr:hypothetical protein [Verrucomicrobiota bacterium]HRZ45004.1 hypothetical protein [Candidatus Paceibacterota bacterium]